jgi:hypothetical protein
MINREDMLELTRRMTPQRNFFTRISGCYLDEEGFVDGTFNTNFLKLSTKDQKYHLNIAKSIPFSKTNEELKEYDFPKRTKESMQMAQLFNGLNDCGFKNDELMEVLYDIISEKMPAGRPYAIVAFHGCYDVPVKALDHTRLDESEEVYDFMICAICPWSGDYEISMPEYGFLYPSFKERSSDENHIAVYAKREDKGYQGLMEALMI